MKKRLLFPALLGVLTACQQERDIQPATTLMAGNVVGVYRTNFYLNPAGVSPTDQVASVELKAESDSTVTLIYTSTGTKRFIPHVLVSPQAGVLSLQLAGKSLGTLQTDRVFTDSGMEKQGPLLRLSLPGPKQIAAEFIGYKP